MKTRFGRNNETDHAWVTHVLRVHLLMATFMAMNIYYKREEHDRKLKYSAHGR